MIDIHSHILPFLDDGAENWEHALELASQAADDGIKFVIATPHHANGRYQNEAEKVHEMIALANKRITEEGIDLQVLPGQEIRVYDTLLEDWDRRKLLSLAGSKYVLLELPTSYIPPNTEELIYELLLMGLQPIIAHPERCSQIASKPDGLRKLIECGALAQLTAQSITGERGHELQKLSLRLYRNGYIHFIATDAHDPIRRPFNLSKAYKVIENKIGLKAAIHLRKNAECIIYNKPIESLDHKINKKKNILTKFFLGKKIQ